MITVTDLHVTLTMRCAAGRYVACSYMYLLEAGELDDRRDTFVRLQLTQVGPSSATISYAFPSPIAAPYLGSILVGEDRHRKGGRAGGPQGVRPAQRAERRTRRHSKSAGVAIRLEMILPTSTVHTG